jgi:hypothetical protein
MTEAEATGDTSMLSAKDRAALTLDAWKKTVDVQQHFNDIGLRIRNLVLTLLGATVAAMGLAGTVPYRVPVLVAALVLIGAFWMMDRHWYHRLLKGAVREGARLEEALSAQGIDVALGRSISAESPVLVFGKSLHAHSKIDLFYLILASISLVSLVFLLPDAGRLIPVLIGSAGWFEWCRSLRAS